MRSRLSLLLAIGLVLSLSLPVTAFAAESEWRQRESSLQNVTTDDVQQEIIFGREVAARILGRYRLYDNKALLKYVNLVGSAVAQNANRPEIEFHFAVVDTGDVNAYAAPGGYVFVTKGAVALMQDEAELAGVLSHEIAHITEKHIVKELNIHGTEDSPASGFARLVGGASESARLAFSQAVDKAIDTLFKDGYKREDETQADKTALSFAALSGYDPSGLVRYLDRVKKAKGKQTEVLDKTHPPYDARLALLKETMEKEGMDPAAFKIQKERFAEAIKGMK